MNILLDGDLKMQKDIIDWKYWALSLGGFLGYYIIFIILGV